ncbi:MAG: TPM domain-containing protein [Leptospiraceae bacterium]|nr:TPM domain-containing protein [Leptospiraceae bacterium]
MSWPVHAQINIPALQTRVTDQTGTLQQNQIELLERKLGDFEKQNGTQLAVLLIATTGTVSIEEYSMRVAEQWQLGQKGRDNGILLVIAKADRRVRIEVGYGLEDTISDARAKQIIDQFIVPFFKAGRYYEGIESATTALLALAQGAPLPEQSPVIRTAPDRTAWYMVGAQLSFMGLIFGLFGILFSFSQSKQLGYAMSGLWLSPLPLFVLLWILSPLSLPAVVLICGILFFVFALIAFLAGMLSGALRGSTAGSSSSGTGFSAASSSFSTGSSFSSSSFSGGGGSFGGGGASGSW